MTIDAFVLGTLALGLLAGLAAIGATHVARKLAPVEWLLVPPLSCETCSSAQGSIIVAGVVCAVFLAPEPAAIALAGLRTVLAAGVGTAVAVAGLKATARLRDAGIAAEASEGVPPPNLAPNGHARTLHTPGDSP